MSTDKDTLMQILVNIKEAYFQETMYDHIVTSQFKQYANQQNQRLDQNSFKKFIDNKTDGISESQISELFKIFDKNRSGTINIEEFKSIFTQIRYMKSSDVKQLIQSRQQQQQQPQYQQQPPYGSPQNNQYNLQYQGATNNVRSDINPNQSKDRNIIIDVYVKDINQKQDLNIDLKMIQQQMAGGRVDVVPQIQMNQPHMYAYQGMPQQNYGYSPHNYVPPNPMSDQSPQVSQQKNLYPPLFNSPQSNPNRNSPLHQQPASQNYPQVPSNPQPNYNSPQNAINSQEQPQVNQGNNGASKYPSLKKPDLVGDQQIVNALIGNNSDSSPSQNNNISSNNQQIDIANEDRIVEQLVTEQPFDSLMAKMQELKTKHVTKQINLFNLNNVAVSKKMGFRDLIKQINSYGVQLSNSEENILKVCLCDKNHETIFIKDFYELLCIKEEKQQKVNPIYPQQMNQISPSPNNNNLNKNNNYPQLNIMPQNNSPHHNIVQPPIANQMYNQPGFLPNVNPNNYNNNNNANQNQLNPVVNNTLRVDGPNKGIDVMRSSIQTRNLYEIDSSLVNFNEFVKKFKECQQSRKPFIDSEFKPCPDSIIQDPTFRKYEEWKNLEWKRPQEFFGKEEYRMFTKIAASITTSRIGLGKLISPADIEQGQLGDCYFLSAVSSLAQEPQRILNLFITRIKNDLGIYCVKICFDGEWRAVYVDDYIPCRYNKPAFTKASDNEIWVVILEKAWAKLFKSYYSIEAGYCREALRDLTGAPTKSIMTQETDFDETGKLFKKVNDSLVVILKEALSKQNKFVVTAGADDEEDLTRSKADRLGLVNSHAYSIIAVKEIKHPKIGNVTLLKLRNPWASKEWTGDWSDNSNLWTPQLKEELRIQNRDDGVFYMSIKDFMQYFDDVCVCYYHDNFVYNSIRLNNTTSKRSSYIRLRVDTEGTYYISVIQPNKRHFPDNYKYSGSRIFIAQITDQQGRPSMRYVGSLQKRDREIFVECNLTPGNYVIQSKIFWETKLTNTYVVSTYGVGKTQLDITDKKNVPPFISECLLQKARKSTKLKPFRQYTDILKETLLETKEGMGYYYIQNNSNKTLDLDANFTSSDSIKLKKPHRMPILKCVVPPKTEFIAPFTVSFKGYSFKCSESYTVS